MVSMRKSSTGLENRFLLTALEHKPVRAAMLAATPNTDIRPIRQARKICSACIMLLKKGGGVRVRVGVVLNS